MTEPTLAQLTEAICEVDAATPFTCLKTEVRHWLGITFHHSKVPRLPKWRVDYAKAFNNFHYRKNQWSLGLGYHFVVTWNPDEPSLTRCQASYRWVHQLNGAHTQNLRQVAIGGELFRPNESTIGVCLVGDFETVSPPPECYQTLAALTQALVGGLWIKPSMIFRHDQFKDKICPGKNFLVSRILELVQFPVD